MARKSMGRYDGGDSFMASLRILLEQTDKAEVPCAGASTTTYTSTPGTRTTTAARVRRSAMSVGAVGVLPRPRCGSPAAGTARPARRCRPSGDRPRRTRRRGTRSRVVRAADPAEAERLGGSAKGERETACATASAVFLAGRHLAGRRLAAAASPTRRRRGPSSRTPRSRWTEWPRPNHVTARTNCQVLIDLRTATVATMAGVLTGGEGEYDPCTSPPEWRTSSFRARSNAGIR